MSPADSIPVGKFGRSLVLCGAAARISARRVQLVVRRPFQSSDDEAATREAAELELAETVFSALSTLKGTALKLAQLLATEIEVLPPSLCTRLADASHRAPAMNRALARKMVTAALGRPELVLRRFDARPFAAASLGQVHAAQTHAGEDVAIKIQYPGMREAVGSDLRLIAQLLRPSRYGPMLADCFDEIETRIRQELDYTREAEQTRHFATRLAQYASTSAIRVPRVFDELSTATVLTTQRLPGCHLQEFLATQPSQALRDRIGQQLVDLFEVCVEELGQIHADPNFGNYLFEPDGSIGVLDFGAVLELSPEFRADLRCVFQSVPGSDPELLEQLYARLGVQHRAVGASREDRVFIQRWLEWVARPHQCRVFDFSQADAYFAEGAALGKRAFAHIERYEGKFAYYARARHGLLRILQQLKSRVCWSYCP